MWSVIGQRDQLIDFPRLPRTDCREDRAQKGMKHSALLKSATPKTAYRACSKKSGSWRACHARPSGSIRAVLIAENIKAAIAQTDHIIAIFDAFLRIAKLESGAAYAAFEAINLGMLVQKVSDIFGAVIEDSGRRLIVEVTNPAIIQGDRVLLVQMLANLIENAMHHTPEGTDIALIADGPTLGLSDTGPGIPQDEYDRITQPLYRLEKSRTTDGAGLGLSLVKTITNPHHADLISSENPNLPSGGLFVRAMFRKAN
ncbi:cell wall metabolism sensor histidine kinase WalK [Pararhizobium sp. IMCC21322]|uniref:sensor histidine kinase n=1 Tax=Pararhizobium sp. IMCC21322 TaxID=3067903 RepID=UPI002740FD72|nr:HAMP domain-containing sensor histidine kinase [Pararhizobium sp. IMCC21322]